ncbi:MAG: hypothetical protein ACI4KH_05975 [Oscillospiraceae bacterium]
MTYKQRYESACCYALSLTAEYNKLLEENRQLRFLLTGDAIGGIIEERYNPNQPRDEKGRWSSLEGGMIDIEIDKFVPCLEDAETGEVLATEISEISRNSLYKYTEQNGWGVNWKDRPTNEYVLGVYLKGESEPQGMISLRKEKGGIYIGYARTAPQNNKLLTGNKPKYLGIGGHLFSAAVEESIKAGNVDGCIFGYAVNRKVLNHYISKLGATHFPIKHEYQFIIDGDAAKNLLDIYNFERR